MFLGITSEKKKTKTKLFACPCLRLYFWGKLSLKDLIVEVALEIKVSGWDSDSNEDPIVGGKWSDDNP